MDNSAVYLNTILIREEEAKTRKEQVQVAGRLAVEKDPPGRARRKARGQAGIWQERVSVPEGGEQSMPGATSVAGRVEG